MSGLSKQLARMMLWRGVVVYPVIALVCAEVVRAFLFVVGGEIDALAPGAFALYLAVTMLRVLCAVAVWLCWFVALWHIFLAGRMAFGVRSALVYTGLAVILAPWPLLFVIPDPVRPDVKLALLLIPWPGLFIVPHMVRLDIKLLLDVEPDESPREARGAEGGTGAPEEIMGFSDEPDAPHPLLPPYLRKAARERRRMSGRRSQGTMIADRSEAPDAVRCSGRVAERSWPTPALHRMSLPEARRYRLPGSE
jgi:hypothetical protein